MLSRLSIFLVTFTVINLIFVPLLSLYGLRVCPVLSIPGFGFGCYYSAAYVFVAGSINASVVWVIFSERMRTRKIIQRIKRNKIKTYAMVYVLATLASLGFLQSLLHLNHLSTKSRAPEILGLASLLLGITQAYGLNWALFDLPYRESNAAPNPSSFRKLWASHVFRTLLPIATVVAVLLHFIFSQSVGFNEGRTAPLASHDQMIEQTSFLILFLMLWLLVTFIFHFLSERDQTVRMEKHFNQLRDLDFKFRSDTEQAWGLWAVILGQLNSFSRIMGERTHLLKSFSRFVTAGVAEQALRGELRQAIGVSRELTVLMSDIRNFTAISEKLPPDQVVNLLNEYFSTMLDVTASHRVSVDKFIGDGILAYVDGEETLDPDAENLLGVDAALAMIAKLENLNAKLVSIHLPELSIGIGIYRGPLVIGLIGSDKKLQHTIIGDTVNRTARLEGLCKELGVSIVLSGHVWHSLPESRQRLFKSFGERAVKGVADAIEVFGGPFL